MKEHLIKGIQKKMTRMVEVSNQCSSPKQAIDDLTQLLFNMTTMPAFYKRISCKAKVYRTDSIYQPLERYRNDPLGWELLNELVDDYLEIVEAQPPFTDVMHLIGYSSKPWSKALGQFLTPPTVAQALIRLSTLGLDEQLANGKHLLVGDNAGSGGGSLLLAFLCEVHTLHPTKTHQAHLFAVDIDYRMVMMTAVQIVLSSVVHQLPIGSLKVHHCNGLTDYNDDTYEYSNLSYVYYSDIKNLEEKNKQNLDKEININDYHLSETLI